MAWWHRIKRWFVKEPLLEEMSTLDRISYLLEQTVIQSRRFDVKLSMSERITVYSKDIGMLVSWINLMIATVESGEYVPEKWKRNPEKIKTMTLDDYLVDEQEIVYPYEFEEGFCKKIDKLKVLLNDPRLSPHKVEYYERQFSPILDDLKIYLVAVKRCSL